LMIRRPDLRALCDRDLLNVGMTMSTTITGRGGQQSGTDIFWGEITPCEHLVQIYEEDGECLDSLERFAADGIGDGDGVIVLATQKHLKALDNRLKARGVDIDAARLSDQYIPLDAEEALSTFMINGWPDDDIFRQFVTNLITRARRDGRRVRAFGELVAVLWARGHNGATVRLEYLWHEICETENLSLYCAYPRIGFTQDASESIKEICAVHSRVIGGHSLLELLDTKAA
jgi:hypothetical protein